jgi:type IV secretory pathway ATPase VirB11/archaellum biosynthesis ATPase
MSWLIIAGFFVLGLYLIHLDDKNAILKQDNNTDIMINPHTGKIYLYHKNTETLETEEGQTLKVFENNKNNWLLEKVGEL